MNLASALAPFADSRIRKRGLQYFRGRRVTLTSCSPDRVSAVVTGSETYQVTLQRAERTIRSICSCPYADRGAPCKHIWAAILAADAQGCLRGADGSLPDQLTCYPAPEGRDAGSGAVRREPARPIPMPRPPMPRPPPTWRELIDQLDDVAPYAPALTSYLAYVIDVRATVDNQQVTLEVFTTRPRQDGAPGKLSTPHFTRSDIPGLPDPADQKILSLLAGAALGEAWTAAKFPSLTQRVPTRCALPKAAEGVLLPLIFATGRCRLRRTPEAEVGEPLAWTATGRGRSGWRCARRRAGSARHRLAAPRRGAADAPPAGAGARARGSCSPPAQVSRLDDPGAFRWLAAAEPRRRPTGARRRAGRAAGAAPRRRPTCRRSTCRSRCASTRRARPSGRGCACWPPWLSTSPPATGRGAELSFLYDGREVPAGAPGRGLYQPEERRLLLRDPEAERRERRPPAGARLPPDARRRVSGEPALRVAHEPGPEGRARRSSPRAGRSRPRGSSTARRATSG